MDTVKKSRVGRMSHHPEGGETNTYLTPHILLAHVYDCFDDYVDLDPCSNSHETPQVRAERYFTEEDDGLSFPWICSTLFMNPPYRYVGKWVRKFIDEHQSGRMKQGIALVAASNDTKWWQEIGHTGALICNIDGRLHFDSAPHIPCKEGARFPSVLFYVGNHGERFIQSFHTVGVITRKVY